MTTFAYTRAQRIVDEVKGVKSQYGIDERAWTFLRDLISRRQWHATPAQERWLADLERKVFPAGLPGDDPPAGANAGT